MSPSVGSGDLPIHGWLPLGVILFEAIRYSEFPALFGEAVSLKLVLKVLGDMLVSGSEWFICFYQLLLKCEFVVSSVSCSRLIFFLSVSLLHLGAFYHFLFVLY